MADCIACSARFSRPVGSHAPRCPECAVQRRHAMKLARDARRRVRQRALPRTRECRRCGVSFLLRQSGYCAPCSVDALVEARAQARADYKARRRGTFVERVDRRIVFARDRWTCGICGGALADGSDRLDPRAPQIDHIVPLAKGGEHSYANIQAAHRACNRQKWYF